MGKLLFSIAQSYYLIEILNLDPQCKKIEETDLSQVTLYLDTNVLIHLLTGTDELKKAMDDLLRITARLGVKIRITERTKEEFLMNLEETSQYISFAQPLSQQATQKVIDVLASGFYRDYLIAKRDNPSLTWQGYEERMKNFILILKNRYSVELEDVDKREVMTDPLFKEVFEAVGDAAPSKSEQVVEHDAFHIILVKHKRGTKRGGILGPPYWFLTNDRSLNLAEIELIHKGGIPSTVTTQNWLGMIWPLMSAEVASKEAPEIFASLFSSITPAALAVNSQDLLLVQGSWLDDRDLTTEDIKEVLGSAYVKSFIRSVRKELEKTGFLFKIKEEQPKVVEVIQPEIKRVKENRKLREDIERINIKIAEDRRKMSITLFILGILCVPAGLYQILTNNVIGIIPLITGLALFSMAFQYRKVKLKSPVIEVETEAS